MRAVIDRRNVTRISTRLFRESVPEECRSPGLPRNPGSPTVAGEGLAALDEYSALCAGEAAGNGYSLQTRRSTRTTTKRGSGRELRGGSRVREQAWNLGGFAVLQWKS